MKSLGVYNFISVPLTRSVSSDRVNCRSNQKKIENAAATVIPSWPPVSSTFGYYTGGKRLPEPNKGDILVVAFDKGWFWYIPLADDMVSVGVVADNDYLLKDRGHRDAENGHQPR